MTTTDTTKSGGAMNGFNKVLVTVGKTVGGVQWLRGRGYRPLWN